MAPSEICRLLGEAKFKDMFLSLNAAAMKLSLNEANLSSVRLPNQTSTRKRNEDWAKRLWNSVASDRPSACKVFLFEWLRQKMVAEKTIGVEDLALLRVTDSVEEVVSLITERTREAASRARRVAETPRPLLGESRPQKAA